MATERKLFEGGVHWFTRFVIPVEIAFPKDLLQCRYCKFSRADANGIRYKCQLTGDILFDMESVPEDCPIHYACASCSVDEHEEY